jgi:4'-phosphopantetheinyl transferase
MISARSTPLAMIANRQSQTHRNRVGRRRSSSELAAASEQGWFATPPPMRVDAVQVLVRPVVECRAPSPGIARWLSDDEQARAARFMKDTDRWRFIEARALLRFVLGQQLDIDPSAIAFVLSSYGKPRQSRPASARGLAFNLSHTVGMIVIALAGEGQRVGVDVEKCGSSVNALDIASTRFCAQESAYIDALPRAAQADAFRQLWTRKEAIHKADGRGLSLALDTFNTLDDHCGAWVVRNLELQPGHVGAVAWQAQPKPLAIEMHLL